MVQIFLSMLTPLRNLMVVIQVLVQMKLSLGVKSKQLLPL